MNKTAKKVVATILTTVMTVGAATVVSADDLSITLSHQPYSHALPSYIGEEEGIFEENGLNTEILSSPAESQGFRSLPVLLLPLLFSITVQVRLFWP